jgi:GxxExxY protein
MSERVFSDCPENRLSKPIIDLCFKVHSALGPGIYESVNESILCHELKKSGMAFVRQKPIDVHYDGECFEEGFRADVIVENLVLLELKSVEKIIPAHKKQVRTYLKVTGLRLGLLVNFGEEYLKDGIYRIVNGLPD